MPYLVPRNKNLYSLSGATDYKSLELGEVQANSLASQAAGTIIRWPPYHIRYGISMYMQQ